MSSFQARLYNQMRFGYVPHFDALGESWQFIKSGFTTSAGASNGTDLTDTNGDSGSADAYNGKYWVKILDGDNRGMWARIVDDSGSGTLTFEGGGFPNQVGAGVSYEIWLSPEPVFVVDSSANENELVDAAMGASVVDDDYLKEFYVVPLTGNRRGRIAKITTHSAGTYTLTNGLGGALAAGDVCLIRKFVEVGDYSPSLDEGFTRRAQKRTNFSSGDGVVGPRGGTISFSAQAVGAGSLGAGTGVGTGPLDYLLVACGMELIAHKNTMTAIAGAGSTSAVVTAGHGARVVPGSIISWNGNIRMVTSISASGGGDTINVQPNWVGSTYPAATDTIYIMRCFKRSEDGDVMPVVIEVEMDGVRTTMTGCKGNFTMQEGVVNTFQFQMSIDHWIRQLVTAPYSPNAAYVSTRPIQGTDKQCWLGTTNTATDMGAITTSPNTNVQPRNVQGSKGINGRSGFQVVDTQPTLTFRQLLDINAELLAEQRWLGREEKRVFVVYGSGPYSMAILIPAGRLIEAPHPSDENGMISVPNVIEAQDAGTAQGYSDTVKYPDYIIAMM